MSISTSRIRLPHIMMSVIFGIVLTTTGCDNSKNNNGGENPPSSDGGTSIDVKPLTLSDPDGTLAAIDVESLEALKKAVDEHGTLSFVSRALQANPNVQGDSIVRALNQNNRNIEYQKLLINGEPEEVVNKLKQIRLSPVAVEKMVQLPTFKFVDRSKISDQALAIYNEQKLIELNNQLAFSGVEALTMDEFEALQTAFESVDMEANYGNLDQQFQNLIVKGVPPKKSAIKNESTNTSDIARAYSAGASYSSQSDPFISSGYSVINIANEKQALTPDSEYPFSAGICYLSSQFNTFPRAISASGKMLEDDFVSNENGNALVRFPQPGIAVMRVTDISGGNAPLRIIKQDGTVLLDQTIENDFYIHLPVLTGEACEPFTFEGASNQYAINIIDMIIPVRMSEHAFVDGGEYLSSDDAEVVGDNSFFNAQSYTFASFDSQLTEFDFLFGLNANDATTTAFDVLVYSPSGKVYHSSNNLGGHGYQALDGLKNTTVAREAGIWRIDLLPKLSTEVANNQLDQIKAAKGNYGVDGQYLNVLTLVTTDPEPKTKEFVLGTMKSLSFTSDGEKNIADEGEVSAMLNTSMAPPIEVPSILDDVINEDTGKLDLLVTLWQCWEKSNKTGFEVAEGGECHIYRSTYEGAQSLFEYENTPDSTIEYYHEEVGSYTEQLLEPCPEKWMDQEVEEGIGLCKKGIGEPYGALSNDEVPEHIKAQMVLNDLSIKMDEEYIEEQFLYTLSNHYSLYESWVARAVQVDTGRYPNHRNLHVKTRDYLYCDKSGGQVDPSCPNQFGIFNAPVIIESNRPIFGAPVELVNNSTDPITFDYAASDADEYNEDAEFFAVLSFIASQSLNIIQSNFAGMVCDTIGLADDLHQLELNAEDDPIGSAKVSINRYSSSDPFYGLHTNKGLEFYMSGVPEENTSVDTHGQNLSYAQIACGLGTSAINGFSYPAAAGFLMSLDSEKLDNYTSMVRKITAMALDVDNATMADDAGGIATSILNGDFENAQARLNTGANVNAITQGRDIYSSPADLLGHYSDQGSAENGNNVIKSNVQYLIEGGVKTRAGMVFERVASVPVTSIDVTFDKVEVIANSESKKNADGAEVVLVPFVGEINDADYQRKPHEPLTVFQNRVFHGYGHRYNHVQDGDILSPNVNVYAFEQERNAAALYVELFISEDDGDSIEDDDMIGIFSQTIKLEEIFNKGQFEWTYLGGNHYQLKIQDYPVYNSEQHRVIENPLSDSYAQQKTHNRKRSPSAKVSFTIDVMMSDHFYNYPTVDTGLNPNPVNPGKDTYSMEMSVMNTLDINGLPHTQIYDVYQDHIILTDGTTMGRKGVVYRYNSSNAELSELFSFDLNNLSGDLQPIKEALTASKSIGQTHPSGERGDGNIRFKALPLFKLLPDNRLLFVISTDAGAKIMVVAYNSQGDLSLASSLDITDIGSNPVYSLGKAALSPDRTGLLIPYIPETYLGSDKSQPVHSSVLYYSINESTIRYQDVVSSPDLTMTSVAFVNNDTFAIQLADFRFVSDKGSTWDQLGEFKQDIHNNCSSTNLDCYFALYGRKIQTFDIDKSDPLSVRLFLSEEINHPYTPEQGGYTTFRNANQMRSYLFENKAVLHLETVSLNDITAVLRSNHAYFELTFNEDSNRYQYTGSFSLTSNSRLRHNALGHYYCAEGLVCSGYMQDALKPRRDDENSFNSSIRVSDFEFADKQRDIIAALIAGENYGDPLRLALLSLYDGAAYKGPQITGAIFDTQVTVSGADDKVTLPFEFTVTDRDTRIDQLLVSVTGLTTETTLAPQNSGTSSPEYSASCTTDTNGNGVCSGEILADFYNADLKQKITVAVSDGVYTSKRHFTIHVEREAPLLDNINRTITLKNPGEYNTLALNIGSINAANNCTVSSFCYLQQNGFVDRWVVTDSPIWLNCSETNGAKGNKLLSCAGTPPLGAQGVYPVQLTAINTSGRDTKTLTITVATPDVTPAPVSFSSQGDVELNTWVESNSVTVSDITGYVAISVTNGEYWRSSTGVWSTAPASDVTNSEVIKLRIMSSDQYSTNQTATLSLAGAGVSFSVTTKADPFVPDTTPDAFSFTALTDQLANDVVTSNSVTITGINQATAISIGGGEYRVGMGAWTSTGATIESGETVQVRHTTSTNYSALVTSTLTIGGVSANFESTTQAIPVPELNAGMGIASPTLGDSFSFTPSNVGGEASSWSISNKPDWASFDTATGELSGTVSSSDNFTISITATNASGSDTFTSMVEVLAAEAPFLNDANCNIDDNVCDFEFTDVALWRSSVNSVVLTEEYSDTAIATLTTPEDYDLSNGQLRLHFNATNNLPKSAGEYGTTGFGIKINASNFNEVRTRFFLTEGEATISAVSVNPPIEAGKISTITLEATNRFGKPVRSFYPTIAVDNDNSDAGALTEVYQYRQASEFGDSNIWKNFGSYNQLAADEFGDASFDFKTPGCVDLNDGFTLSINNYDLIYNNSTGDCVEVEWTTREEESSYSDLTNNMVVDSQHHVYRVTILDNKLSLTKFDQNGQIIWTKPLTTQGTSWFKGIEMVDGSLFIAGSTNADIDGEGDAIPLGEFDVFVQRLDLEGNIIWTRYIGTAEREHLSFFSISHDMIYLQVPLDKAHNHIADEKMYRLDLNGNNQQVVLNNAELSATYGYTHGQIDASGNYYLLARDNKGLKKHTSAGEVIAANIDTLKGDVTDMKLVGDALYFTVNVKEADIIEGETWNTDEASAVRVVRLRASDLSVVWSHLIQSDATYENLSNSKGQLAYVNGVLYVSVVANQELYYEGLALDKTPLYSLNLLAFNADGAEKGMTGNTNGKGEILSHQSWLTGPKHATDNKSDPFLKLEEMIVSNTGWVYHSLMGTQAFNSTGQMGRHQTPPYSYKVNAMLFKTKLAATPFSLLAPQTGLTRNSYFEVVTDHDNRLQWIDTVSSNDSYAPWSFANSHCSTVSWPSTDWRLPTPEEMGRVGSIPAPDSAFKYYNTVADNAYYWSNEQNGDGWHIAIEIATGFGDAFPDSDELYFRCVKDLP